MLTKYRESSIERTISYILTVFLSTSFLDSETIWLLSLRDSKFKSIEDPYPASENYAIYELLDAVIQWWIDTKGLPSFWDFELAIQLNLYSIEKCILNLHYHSEIQFRFLICLMLTLNDDLTPHTKYHSQISNSQFSSIYIQ